MPVRLRKRGCKDEMRVGDLKTSGETMLQRIYVIITEFYHLWNRNIVPNSAESLEALTR